MDHESRPSTKGHLLVASPDLEDPNFRRAVVYVLAHDPGGALGVILNRPGRLPAAAALPAWAARAAEPALLFQGGPVETGGVIGLGRDEHGRAVPLDLAEQPQLAGRDAAIVRLFAGYAGWGPGQLDGELAFGGWIVVDAEPEDVFSAEPANLWRRVLGRQDGPLGWLGGYPDDVRAN